MAFSVPAAYLTHQQKVLRLYKRALRHLESWCVHRWEQGPRIGRATVDMEGERPGPRPSKDFGDRMGGRCPLPGAGLWSWVPVQTLQPVAAEICRDT